MLCPSCNSDKTESGQITNIHGVVFKADYSAFMFPKESSIVAKVCLDCGALFDFKANELEKLNK